MLRKAISKLMLFVVCVCFLPMNVHAESHTYDVPSNSSFKSYMDYGTITNTSSRQYLLQKQCVTTPEGLRTFKGYYTIALGQGFGASVGDYIDVELSTGTILHCIIGDMKKNKDTNAANIQVSHNGNIVEFIVDKNVLDGDVRRSGNISNIRGFEGYVKNITVLGSANIDEQSIQTIQPVVTVSTVQPEYLIMGKSAVPMDNGDTLYMVEYIFGDDYNSIICSPEFYDSVSLGDTVTALE